jgi:hypothetical protein
VRKPHGGDAKNDPRKQRGFKCDGANPDCGDGNCSPEMPRRCSLLSVTGSSTSSMGGEARSIFAVLCTVLSSCMKISRQAGKASR